MRLPVTVCRVALSVLLLASCAVPARFNAAPVVKLGLIAPFEGLERPLGYAVLPAVKAAVAEANASGQLGSYQVSLVALNDDGHPATAAAQVAVLAQDSDVVAALAGWSSDTAAASASALEAAGLPGLLAAPVEETASTTYSLCPSPAELAGALTSISGESAVVAGPPNALAEALGLQELQNRIMDVDQIVYTGDAAGAADELVHWRAAGWRGMLLGGPDIARPWLVARAGASAVEGTRAVVCASSGTYSSGAEPPLNEAASLAYEATRTLLLALSSDIAAHNRPSPLGTGGSLADVIGPPSLLWLEVEGGSWVIP